MTRSRPSARPYARPSASLASRLAQQAGSAPSSMLAPSARVERLEPRQMLFSLTIAPSAFDPFATIGTATAIFGYTLPVFQTTEEFDDDAEADTRDEDFADNGVGLIPQVFEFDESFLAIRHNVVPGFDVQAVADVDDDGDLVDGTERLRLRLGLGENISFEFDSGEDVNNGQDLDLPLTAVSFTIDRAAVGGGNNGLPIATSEIVLTLRGEEVGRISGQEIVGRFAVQDADAQQGVGQLVLDAFDDDLITSPFDRVQIVSTGNSAAFFEIDNFQATLPVGAFAPIVDSRIFGAEIQFTGPIGASVQILDLYGRSMVPTIALGTPEDAGDFVIVDPDDDGVPNFNDGIGQIILRNVDAQTSLTISGGSIETGNDPNTPDGQIIDGVFEEGDFSFTRTEDLLGLYDEFEEAGFGYAFSIEDDDTLVTGLPPGPGSVVIGAPLVRPQANYNPLGTPPGLGNFFSITDVAEFNRIDQGIFVEDGSAMGEVIVHGVLHGTSRFTSTLDVANVGYLVGSMVVDGDLGKLVVGSDAGVWNVDPGFLADDDADDFIASNSTGSSLFVGRSVNEIFVGGRSLMEVEVQGDTSDPINRPARDPLRYQESEYVIGVDEGVDFDEEDYFNAYITRAIGTNLIAGGSLVTGAGSLRNDTIINAEFVGGLTSAVEVRGEVGFGNPALDSVEDAGDVFAFAVNGENAVTVQFQVEAGGFFAGAESLTVRIVDQDGRTLVGNASTNFTVRSSTLQFEPERPGVYYLVVQSPGNVDGDTDVGTSYRIALNGLAPTTLGSFRTGAGAGGIVQESAAQNVTVGSGSAGLIRIGTGVLNGSGENIDPSAYVNTNADTPDEVLEFGAGVINVDESLYTFIAGGDIEPIGTAGTGGTAPNSVVMLVGGDLGAFYVGLSELLGLSSAQGDVGEVTLQVGGGIGEIDIRGAVNLDQDTEGFDVLGGGPFTIQTGLDSARTGDIGTIRVGSHIANDSLRIETPDGSTIGAFLVSQDSFDTPGPDGTIGISQGGNALFNDRLFTTGFGSDIRFVDFPRIDLASVDADIDLNVNESVELIDDSGGKVRITINGGGPGAVGGLVRFLPIEGSQGVAVATIEANLSGGRTLNIESVGETDETAPISIGRIRITDSTALSDIFIEGDLPVDIYRIEQTGGTGFGTITQSTPGGDIVAIDVASLANLTIEDGNLGITELPAIAKDLIGPELGVAAGGASDIGEELAIPAAAMDENWGGGVHRPTNDGNTAPGTAYLSDIGGPFDTFLNGLVVRSGDLTSAEIAGAVGDLIVQSGRIVDLVVDSDNETPFGEFHGIVGTIFATDIDRLVIGDGLAPRATNPIATTGIFATDDIISIEAGDNAGANIESVIIAANTVVDPLIDFDGISSIELDSGGDFLGAYIGTTQLDGFVVSIEYNDDNVYVGTLDNLTGDGADFFQSIAQVGQLGVFELNDGFFDASQLDVLGPANTISATGYRNSTIAGTDLEFRAASIVISEDVEQITTEQPDGDYSDILIDVLGEVNDSIDGDVFTRVNLQVDGDVEDLEVAGSFLAGQINVGSLLDFAVGDRLAASLVRVSGPIETFDVGGSIINTDIGVTGPSGRIEDIDVAGEITGTTVRVTGPIGSISSGVGDLEARVITEGPRGNVGLLSAARDLIVETDVSQGVAGIAAGRHIGRLGEPAVILVRGDLVSINIPDGQLYSDIRVGGTIGVNQVQVGAGTGDTGGQSGVTIGRANNLAATNDLGTGSIAAFDRIGDVVINGDFAGTIETSSNSLGSVIITNGSLTQNGAIRALNGSIESLTITNGHLLGDVFADLDIMQLVVDGTAPAAGAGNTTFGNIGIDPNLSALNPVGDGFRNELPLGATSSPALDGPSIVAGRDILDLTVTNGSVFEADIRAGRDLVAATINGRITVDASTRETGGTSTVIAGRGIGTLDVSGTVRDTVIGAGFFDLGTDSRPGGVNLAGDVVRAGAIDVISIGGNARNVDVIVGATAGSDGIYGNGNDRQALGVSSLGGLSIGGAENDVVVIGENLTGIDGRAEIRTNLQSADQLLVDGAISGGQRGTGATFPNGNGELGTITITGPGQAFWSSANSTLTLSGTTSATTVAISSANGRFTDINIVSTNDAALASLAINADLFGNSNIVIDGDVAALVLQDVDSSGRISVGGAVTTLAANNILGGFLNLGSLGTGAIAGDLGGTNADIRGEAALSTLTAGTITIGGDLRALINVERSADRIAVDGAINNANIRVGWNLGTATTTATSAGGGGTVGDGSAALSAGSVSESRISVGDEIGPVFVGDDFFDSALLIGGDLGSDGEIGGVGINADNATAGFGSNVTIAGGFAQSDIVAGALRGPDGFFGTSDDSFGPGRARVGNISIGENELGSNRFTESYRISSSGILGDVNVAGQAVTELGNFAVVDANPLPVALRVDDLRVELVNQFYTATINFNLPIDFSSLDSALSIREVRGSSGQVEIFLTEGLDYTLIPQPNSNAIQVRFERDITSRDLPQIAGTPGPGVYRFVIDPTLIRSQVAGALLDGDGDGFARGADDFFSQDDIVGDAGDRVVAQTRFPAVVTASGDVETFRVDLYEPVNLDIVLDDNRNSDGIADANVPFTLRGVIGDHPDENINVFRAANDIDVYEITLQEGQILRLGDVEGAAPGVTRAIVPPSGQPFFVGENAQILSLPAATPDVNDLSTTLNYLIRQTGQYLIVVSSGADATEALSIGDPSNPAPVALAQGDYRFSIEVFDDGDSGFSGSTNASNGTDVVEAPAPSIFPANRTTLTIDGFTFNLDVGPDGQRNTSDDIVTGDNGRGISSELRDGVVTSRIDSAIGPENQAGLPNNVFADIDVFHIDDRNLIEPGVQYRVTVELTQLGSDLGSRGVDRGVDSEFSFENFSGFVQFGIFDTTGSTSIGDADQVLAPTDFSPNGGTPGVIAENGDVSYGYDDEGNFFVEFVTLGELGTQGDAASYAVYLQGAFNADYSIEIARLGEGTFNARSQNIFLETLGGEIDWLFASGRIAELGGFDPGVLGIVGSVADGRSVEDFILEELIDGLNEIYGDSGFDVRFSANPNDFEFEDFSTVFLSSTNDPISVIFEAFDFQQFGGLNFLTQPLGFAEHSDALNSDTQDEAVVFLPSLSVLGYTPTQTGIEDLVDSLTAVVGQQVGELLGLRVSSNSGIAATQIDVLSSNSPANVPSSDTERYAVSTIDRALSGAFDSNSTTDFWLGEQNSASLLDKVLGN